MLSEESADVDFATRAGWTRYWLVDPLDGTKDFVKRNGEFTVNIALIDRHAPVLGVVAVPVTGVCYAAGRGLGARPLRRRRHVRAPRPHAGREALAGRGQPVPRRPEDRGVHPQPRSVGAGLHRELSQVLSPRPKAGIDIYPRFGPTCEWDTAAAQCVVEQAGGRGHRSRLEPLRCNTGESFLNPYFLAFGDAAVDWREFLPDEARRPGPEP